MEINEMSNAMTRVVKHLIKTQTIGRLKEIITHQTSGLTDNQKQKVYEDVIEFANKKSEN